MDNRSASPPPYLSQDDEKGILSLTFYAFAATPQQIALSPRLSASASYSSSSTPAHQHHSITILQVRDTGRRRVRYSATIPKKREGWKADLSFVNEKEREEHRFEIRREPMARRYDFRDPQGNHNVMIPSGSLSHKSFSIEATDGQKLLWKRDHNSWDLLSLPSQTLLARYKIATSRSNDRQEEQSKPIELGRLEIYTIPPSTESAPPVLLDKPQRTNSTSSHSSGTSSTTSSQGPRLGRAYRSLAIGICAPAVVSAAIASPHACAGMNRFCSIGDELTNLGRASIKAISSILQDTESASKAARESWLHMNESNPNRKNNDPRPRNVELDVVVSSLIAVLAG